MTTELAAGMSRRPMPMTEGQPTSFFEGPAFWIRQRNETPTSLTQRDGTTITWDLPPALFDALEGGKLEIAPFDNRFVRRVYPNEGSAMAAYVKVQAVAAGRRSP